MNIILKASLRFYLFAVLAAIFVSATATHAQSYAEGVSEVLNTTTSTDLYTFTNTYITYDLAAYYKPSTQAQLLDNGTQVAYGDTQGPTDVQDAELDGHVPNLRTGDDYEVDGAHFLIERYSVYDPGSGNTYYENPSYYGFTDGYQSSGYDYTGGGGDYYTVENVIFLGYTASAVSTAVPQITGISPSGAAKGTSSQTASGQITVSGSHLVDVFDGSTTPSVLSGSGLSLTTGSLSATQVILNYSIDPSAATGARQFTLSNRFGPSEPQTFTVGDPTPVITDVEPHLWPAGTVIPLTITGSGFGIAPTVTIAGVGLLTPSPAVTGSTDNSISTSVSIALDAPDGPATVTVQSHGSGGNGFVQGTPGQSSSGSNSADINAAPAPIPQIMFLGTNITGTTQTVVAGQQIALSVSPPSGFTIASQSWSFSNQAAISGGFTNTVGNSQPSASGGGKEAADPPLNQSGLTFYWVNPGDNGETVTYTYTLNNGRSASATATFNIGGPTGNLLPSAFAQSGITGTSLTNVNSTALMSMVNSPTKPGVGVYINDNAQPVANAVQCPPGPGGPPTAGCGQFIWVQILNSVTQYQIVQAGDTFTPSNASNQLDGTYPYASGPGSPNATWDSPGRGLLASWGEGAEPFSATMYVLWDPALPAGCTPAWVDTTTSPYYTPHASTCTSTPIPLGSVQWGWSACAINALASAPGGGTTPSWFLQCGTGSGNSAGTASGYPQWSSGTGPGGCSKSDHANCQ